MNKKGILGNWIGGFVVIIIVIMIYPTLVEQLEIAARSSSNVSNLPISDSVSTILGLMLLFFVLGISILVFNIVTSGLRGAGLISGSSDEEEEEEDSDEDESDKTYECEYCEKEIIEKDERTCNKCEENNCIYCRKRFGEYNYCKDCYKEIMKKTEKVKEVKKEVEIKEEVEPIMDFENNKFEGKTKYD